MFLRNNKFESKQICYDNWFWDQKKKNWFSIFVFMHIGSVAAPVGQLIAVFYCVPNGYKYFDTVDLEELHLQILSG